MEINNPLWQYVASLSMLPYTQHLSNVTLCYDENHRPICYAGRAVLVCKVLYRGEPKVMRVYMTCRNNLRQIYGESYYPSELPILNMAGKMADYADVVLLDWHEGQTLQRVLERRGSDSEYIHRLSRRFEQLALWLLDQEWAHGDIKPDNIIVDGEEIHLIDFDAVYLPSFSHFDCEEIGSAQYQHPTRSMSNFSKAIDDYPLALIITVLAAVAYDASLAEMLRADDMLLISPIEAVQGEAGLLRRIEQLFVERCDARHYRIAQLLRSPHFALYRLREYIAMESSGSESTEGFEIATQGGLWGYKVCDEWVIPPLYDLTFEPQNGACKVVLNGRVLRLNSRGEIID